MKSILSKERVGSVPVGAVCSLEYLIFLPYERTETEICKVKSKKEAFIFHIS